MGKLRFSAHRVNQQVVGYASSHILSINKWYASKAYGMCLLGSSLMMWSYVQMTIKTNLELLNAARGDEQNILTKDLLETGKIKTKILNIKDGVASLGRSTGEKVVKMRDYA